MGMNTVVFPDDTNKIWIHISLTPKIWGEIEHENWYFVSPVFQNY